jgi:hypothetical protein
VPYLSIGGSAPVGMNGGYQISKAPLCITGPTGSAWASPGTQHFLNGDVNSTFQALSLGHDSIYLNFDCATTQVGLSSSNLVASYATAFRIVKQSGQLQFRSGQGLTAGNTMSSTLAGAVNGDGSWSFPTAVTHSGGLTVTGGTTTDSLTVSGTTTANTQNVTTQTVTTGTITNGTITNATLTNAPIVTKAVSLMVTTFNGISFVHNASVNLNIGSYTSIAVNTGGYASTAFFNASNQFTPPVKGLWFLQVSVPVTWGGSINNLVQISMQANSTDGVSNVFASNSYPVSSTTAQGTMTCSGFINANGSTDYVNVAVYANSGANTTNAGDIPASSTASVFQAVLIARTG